MIVTTYENNRCPVADCKHCFIPTERYLDWVHEQWELKMRWHWHAPPPVTLIERETTLLPDWIHDVIKTEVGIVRKGLGRAPRGRR